MSNQLKSQCKKHLHWQVSSDGDSQRCIDCGFEVKGLWKKQDTKMGYSRNSLQKGVTLERLVKCSSNYPTQGFKHQGYGFYNPSND